MAKTDGPMVVMMTGYGSVESAVSCKMGAFDYVVPHSHLIRLKL